MDGGVIACLSLLPVTLSGSPGAPLPRKKGGRSVLLSWALIFFVIALVAALFGFTGIAVAAAGIAKILFFIFFVLFIVALITGLFRRPRR